MFVLVRGDYPLYLGDDDAYLGEAFATLDHEICDEVWGVFPNREIWGGLFCVCRRAPTSLRERKNCRNYGQRALILGVTLGDVSGTTMTNRVRLVQGPQHLTPLSWMRKPVDAG